jgi:hypothetical protein
MATISLKNSYANTLAQYSLGNSTWADISSTTPTIVPNVIDIYLSVNIGSSDDPNYVIFSLCFNMGAEGDNNRTDKGASVNVEYFSDYSSYCKLSSFSSNKNFYVTIQE